MDPRGKGAAVFAVDGEFSQNGSSVSLQHHYDRATGATAHAAMQKLHREQGGAMQANLRKETNALGSDYRYPSKKVWAPTPVISEAFTQRVQQKIAQPPSAAKLAPPRSRGRHHANEPIAMDEARMAPLRHEIRATQTARTLDARGIREVTDAAKRIAEVAADLRGYPLSSHPAQSAPNASGETSAPQSSQRRR